MSTPSPKIYLAGPITGKTASEANDWRESFSRALAESGFVGVSPLRCEPIRGNVYNSSTESDPMFGTPRAIASKNYLDVQRCDLTLCYFPTKQTEQRVSLGTVIELAWAFSLRKPTILVSDYAPILEHPVMQANAGWIVKDLDQAMEIIKGVFTIYRAA